MLVSIKENTSKYLPRSNTTSSDTPFFLTDPISYIFLFTEIFFLWNPFVYVRPYDQYCIPENLLQWHRGLETRRGEKKASDFKACCVSGNNRLKEQAQPHLMARYIFYNRTISEFLRVGKVDTWKSRLEGILGSGTWRVE